MKEYGKPGEKGVKQAHLEECKLWKGMEAMVSIVYSLKIPVSTGCCETLCRSAFKCWGSFQNLRSSPCQFQLHVPPRSSIRRAAVQHYFEDVYAHDDFPGMHVRTVVNGLC